MVTCSHPYHASWRPCLGYPKILFENMLVAPYGRWVVWSVRPYWPEAQASSCRIVEELPSEPNDSSAVG